MSSPAHLRIISLLPSATEIACALGLADQLVGITHCCDFPPEVIEHKPLVVHGAIPVHEMSLREIDAAVSQHLRSGESLYHVDLDLLRQLSPSLILTQDLCQVCAPAGNEVSRALHALTTKPDIVWMSPHSLADIENDILAVGQATHHEQEAEGLIQLMRARREKVAMVTSHLMERPSVFCAEWLDPLFCSGHWVPEMVEIAGGVDPLGRKWRDSVRIEWEIVRAAEPEIIIVMACGFNCAESMNQIDWLLRQPGFDRLPAAQKNKVFVVDAGYFSRPGPRVIEGIELLAHLIHPQKLPWHGASNAFSLPSLALPT
jgi:iron complex transport system substrate-binding protein